MSVYSTAIITLSVLGFFIILDIVINLIARREKPIITFRKSPFITILYFTISSPFLIYSYKLSAEAFSAAVILIFVIWLVLIYGKACEISSKEVHFHTLAISETDGIDIRIKIIDIESVDVNQGPVGKALGFGTIHVKSPGPEIVMSHVFRPFDKKDLILHLHQTQIMNGETSHTAFPQIVNGHNKSSYIIYCKSCRKEYYVNRPAADCPKCGARNPLRLDFQIVKNQKLNEFIMYVIAVVGAITFMILVFAIVGYIVKSIE